MRNSRTILSAGPFDARGWIQNISRICEQLDPEAASARVMKRLQFLCYEFESLLPAAATAQEKLETLNRFFFVEKEFQAVADEAYSSDPTPIYMLSRVLSTRIGSSLSIAVLYSALAQTTGLTLQFVDLRPTCFLKLLDDGVSRFMDLSKAGRILSSDELIASISKRFQNTDLSFCARQLCEVMSFERFTVDYLNALKSGFIRRGDAERLLCIQNHLLEFQPSNLVLVGERAVLLRKLGKFRSALNDLQRYFAFHERDKSPVELVNLFDELRAIFQKQQSQIEIVE